MADDLRALVALKLSKLSGVVAGNRPLAQNEEIRRLRSALGEITVLLPAEHPACRIAVGALADGLEADHG